MIDNSMAQEVKDPAFILFLRIVATSVVLGISNPLISVAMKKISEEKAKRSKSSCFSNIIIYAKPAVWSSFDEL